MPGLSHRSSSSDRCDVGYCADRQPRSDGPIGLSFSKILNNSVRSAISEAESLQSQFGPKYDDNSARNTLSRESPTAPRTPPAQHKKVPEVIVSSARSPDCLVYRINCTCPRFPCLGRRDAAAGAVCAPSAEHDPNDGVSPLCLRDSVRTSEGRGRTPWAALDGVAVSLAQGWHRSPRCGGRCCLCAPTCVCSCIAGIEQRV